VEVLRDFSTGYHTRNGGGDTITTDGDLPIVDVGAITVPPQVAQHPPSDSRNKRPAPTIVGALLAGARAVAAIVAVVSGFLSPDDLLQGLSIQSDDGSNLTAVQSEVVLYAGLGFVGLVALGELLLAWLVFLGSNRARVTAMALSTAAIATQAIDVVNGGSLATLEANLPGLTLDILLILALSSERARIYARRDRKEPKRDSTRPGGRAPF
jgi:hypothetical protein